MNSRAQTAGGQGPCVLALDLGTSSVRSAVFDTEARMISPTLARRQGVLESDSRGMAQMDPAALLDVVQNCVAATLESWRACPQACGITRVDAIGMSCFWHSLLGLHNGQPVTPIYSWADARARMAAESLRCDVEEPAVHRRTGAMLRSTFWPAKLRWLRSDGVHSRVDQWCGPAEWVLARLFGRPIVLGWSMASGTGLLRTIPPDSDNAPGVWDAELCAACGVSPEQLPPLDDSAHPAVPPQDSPAAGLIGSPVAAPLGDGAASNIGSGATRQGIAALNFGTSAAVRIVSESRDPAPPGLFRFLIDERRALYGGAVSNAGNLHRWCTQVLRLPEDAEALNAQLETSPEPVEDLLVLPFLVNERSPTWPEGQRAAWTGLSAATTALDIYRASMDAVLQRLAQIYDALPRDGSDPHVVATGGSTGSTAFLHRLANVFGAEIEAGTEPEASLRGAAVRALETLGLQAPDPPPGPRIHCDRSLHHRYLAMRPRYAQLEALLKPAGLS